MPKIKLTKGELKRQRDSLEQFRHYLPTLQLKKQQLQMKILEARLLLEEKESEFGIKEKSVNSWIGLLSDPQLGLLQQFKTEDEKKIEGIRQWVVPEKVNVEIVNVAGANVPVFQNVEFENADYNYYWAPLWIDKGIAELREFISLLLEIDIIKQGLTKLIRELRVTTQRVNLFEKIKIPECLENIRKIGIYLGDQQANAVGICKVAKKKIELSAVAV